MLKSCMAKFHVLIPAAGSGSRMASDRPKQYLPILGLPLMAYSLNVFTSNDRISTVNIVLSADDVHWQKQATQKHAKIVVHYCGGETRAASVLNGLSAMNQVADDDWVLVHDAARPGLTDELLNRLLDSVKGDAVGGLLAIPLADTLKRADSAQRVARTEPREHLWQAQTPQMFPYALLKNALQHGGCAPTDEAQAVEALGLQPKLVLGDLRNFKVTYPQDLALMEAILSADKKTGVQQ
jgi:2-C-methyl-D-erythritol 4-phosphate cytidylyltransferase